jgi:hypothetical protein
VPAARNCDGWWRWRCARGQRETGLTTFPPGTPGAVSCSLIAHPRRAHHIVDHTQGGARPLASLPKLDDVCALEPDRAARLLTEAMHMIRKAHLHGPSEGNVFAQNRIMAYMVGLAV